VFLSHPVSLLLSTLRVSWCTCHSLDLLFWLGGFPGAWMLFWVAVSANPTGLTVLSLGDRFVCALGGSAAQQPTTNHISLAVSILAASGLALDSRSQRNQTRNTRACMPLKIPPFPPWSVLTSSHNAVLLRRRRLLLPQTQLDERDRIPNQLIASQSFLGVLGSG
jgi:hypothetical protein